MTIGTRRFTTQTTGKLLAPVQEVDRFIPYPYQREVSARYLDEFTFRSIHRHMQNAMVDLLIGAL